MFQQLNGENYVRTGNRSGNARGRDGLKAITTMKRAPGSFGGLFYWANDFWKEWEETDEYAD